MNIMTMLLLLCAVFGNKTSSMGAAAAASRLVGVVATCANRSDCTAELQAALDSGAHFISVPPLANPPGPWLVGPLFINTKAKYHTNLNITFEPGCVVEALSGEAGRRAYKKPSAVLFTANYTTNLTIVGYGATWRMQRQDLPK